MLLQLRTRLKRGAKKAYRNLLGLHSQYGEDLVIRQLMQALGIKTPGFYVDVGAHDPKLFSNTYLLYRKGWSGINIEPNVDLYAAFVGQRIRDLNLNIGIASSSTTMTFYQFDASTLSTFSLEQSHIYKKLGHKLIKVSGVEVWTLNKLFEQYVRGREINFLSLDIEGFELDVLSGNDWNCYRPNAIICETINHGSEINKYINDKGYIKYFSNGTNSIYYDEKFQSLDIKKFNKPWFL